MIFLLLFFLINFTLTLIQHILDYFWHHKRFLAHLLNMKTWNVERRLTGVLNRIKSNFQKYR